MTTFQNALVKFNGGRGALLCNLCSTIIRQDFCLDEIEDKKYVCQNCCQATFKEHCHFPHCDCDRPEPDHPDTCRCEECRFWGA